MYSREGSLVPFVPPWMVIRTGVPYSAAPAAAAAAAAVVLGVDTEPDGK